MIPIFGGYTVSIKPKNLKTDGLIDISGTFKNNPVGATVSTYQGKSSEGLLRSGFGRFPADGFGLPIFEIIGILYYDIKEGVLMSFFDSKQMTEENRIQMREFQRGREDQMKKWAQMGRNSIFFIKVT